MDNITSILTANDSAQNDQEIEGVVLDDPWVTSGTSFENDHVDLLVHRDNGSVVRVRVLGLDAQRVAGDVARGDRVRGRLQGRRDAEGVVLVESLAVV